MIAIIEDDKFVSRSDQATYVNRMGDTYFAHRGLTKTGKPKYFASKKDEGALEKLPDGLVFGESINGIVTIQRPKPLLVPQAEIDLVVRRVGEFQHLKHYRVEAKGKAILIHEPMGLESINTLAELGSYSIFDDLKNKLGSTFDDALARTAKDMGISVSDWKRADALFAAERRKNGKEYLIRNIQYDAVMRLTRDQTLGLYFVERRCYLGEINWAYLETCTLAKLLKKYIRHIGKESFFELM
jgi:hypothetical protein